MKIVRDLGTLTFQLHNTPPENENCQRSWHFDFSVTEYPPPPKMKIVRDLGTLTFQLQNTPPPRKWKLSEILALWLFSYRIPPPPQNWNLGRSWHLWLFSFQNTPPENENCQRSWHFDFPVTEYPPPHLGRSSQWETMCGKLPHVETLSNPDNYSLMMSSAWPHGNAHNKSANQSSINPFSSNHDLTETHTIKALISPQSILSQAITTSFCYKLTQQCNIYLSANTTWGHLNDTTSGCSIFKTLPM